MLIAAFVLFATVMLSGTLVRLFPPADMRWLKIALSFSGAYLFTITIIHLLPDALATAHDPHELGYWVLAGFFLQLVLELFSHGIEHGHIHPHNHGHSHSTPVLLLASLFIHSFLEGTILVDQGSGHAHAHQHVSQNFYQVLFGIAAHHVPAAFALMSVLVAELHSARKAWLWLLIFAVGGPLGILVSNTILADQALGPRLYLALTGLVAGNFLHISTTILFETSPEHRFNRNKLIATVLGLGLALAGDFFS